MTPRPKPAASTRPPAHSRQSAVPETTPLLQPAAHARLDDSIEWLEPDALGGFAMGTATAIRTRRYHSLLTAALGSPTDRVALVKGLDAWIHTPDGTFALSTQRYLWGHHAPDGVAHLVAFTTEPWPRWEYRLPTGLRVAHELLVTHGSPCVALSWRVLGHAERASLIVRPLLSGAPMHALHSQNPAFRFDALVHDPTSFSWNPYPSALPALAAATNGAYAHEPVWYRALWYAEETRRGFDACEDLASPGALRWDVAADEAVLLLSAGTTPETDPQRRDAPAERMHAIRARERARRASFASPLHRAADAFVVRRGPGRTVVAGYPWFADWGRDTFIALRGLLAAGLTHEDARLILTEWAGAVSEGMVPNRFADGADEPEYNAVDASLWFVIAAAEHLDACHGWIPAGPRDQNAPLRRAILDVVGAYARGTRYSIRMDADSLLAAGQPGVQLTWMDARVHAREITPRVGKPVEVQALWINALRFAQRLDPRWGAVADRATASFHDRFWNPDLACLYDVVDADHHPGRLDASLRPNQILAVAGLPVRLVLGERARSIVDTVERELLTPLGLRSLARAEPGYNPRYEGGPADRDAAYHTGTVWPWLLGPFVEAWVRVRGSTPDAAAHARANFLAPMLAHLREGGLNSVSEIFDAEPPRLPRGCPFQAWSVTELLRAARFLDQVELDPTSA